MSRTPATRAPLAAASVAIAVAFLVCSACGGSSREPVEAPADLVLRGGKIVTLEPGLQDVSALAARDGRIVALGTDAEIADLIGPETEVFELDGRLATPGLIEAHGHFEGFGWQLKNVDLMSLESWNAVVEAMAAAAAREPAGRWLVGRGWHQEKWSEPFEPSVEGYPVHDRLSDATPDHPVILVHASGHATLVNAEAMRLANVDASTSDPPGGTILRKADGSPTGVLREKASALVAEARAAAEARRSTEERLAERKDALRLAMDGTLAAGITTFHDAGVSIEDARLFREMADAGELRVRLWVMLREGSERLDGRLDDLRWIGHGDDMLTVRAIKLSIDGALGSHGAWLLEPYTDLPGTSGLNTVPIPEVEKIAELAVEHDMQFCVHAIGDRANRETLDIFERALGSAEAARAARWRVEHAQHLHPDDIDRFAALGILPSMQGVHCTSDGPWVPKRIGDARAESGAYVWRRLIEAGSIIANGTDVPVEPIDPIRNFHATVTRKMANGEAFYPDQAMNRLEALRSMTWNAAYFGFEEEIKGSLAPGKLADVTVFSQDLLTVPENAIRDTRIDATILGGEVVFRAHAR